MTLAALEGKVEGADAALAYGDVLNAWKVYLARDNHGRGYVLVGHSQGSNILRQLIAQEIDGKPAQHQLISAILPGAPIAVPADGFVGGSFKHIPLCRRADEYGCVIAYSSYLALSPPNDGARFGADPAPGEIDACVDPAQLLGHKTLQAELPTVGRLGVLFGTDFIENPDLISAQCARSGAGSYLAISVGPGGELLAAALANLQTRRPDWGLHALDMNLALGDLVELVGRQSAAWAMRR
jgi:hypothetical protein